MQTPPASPTQYVGSAVTACASPANDPALEHSATSSAKKAEWGAIAAEHRGLMEHAQQLSAAAPRKTYHAGTEAANNMLKAIEGWKNKTGDMYTQGMSKNDYCSEVNAQLNISRGTLQPYIREVDPKVFAPK